MTDTVEFALGVSVCGIGILALAEAGTVRWRSRTAAFFLIAAGVFLML